MLSKHSLNQGTKERMSNSLVWVPRWCGEKWKAFAPSMENPRVESDSSVDPGLCLPRRALKSFF